MQYFVTGATGFIGRFLVAELLKRPGAQVLALVRPGSEARLDDVRQKCGATKEQVVAVPGDLTQAGLGLSAATLHALTGRIDHFFHLAAIYDLKADAAAQLRTNIDGTRNALDAAANLRAGCFHHVSSIAAGGLYPGRFTEKMFDEAVGLSDPYFFTKHESEKCVRNETRVPWRVYRPSMVVGDSHSGAMDKVDGPYYLFKIMQRAQQWLPDWLPLLGIEGGKFNIVPVDYVVKAMDHIAHTPGLDQQCFHLTADQDYNVSALANVLAKAAGAPQFKWYISNNALNKGPKQVVVALAQWAPVKLLIERVLKRLGLPVSILGFLSYPTTYDRSNTVAALAGTSLTPPPLESYIDVLWRYWQEHLDR